MRTLAIIASFFILYGCGSATHTNTKEDSVALDTLQPDGTVTDTSEISTVTSKETPKKIKTYKGLYISGNEVNTFRDCTNGKVYWIEDESKKLSEAYKKTMVFLSYPYESVYAEVKGYLKGKSNIGYAQEYDNVLAVTVVDLVKQKSFRTECYNYEFACFGNEPFWAVDIIPSENIIALKDVGNEKTYTFPYKPRKLTGNTITYQTFNDAKEGIKILITKEPCSDGMSDRAYNYSAQVTFNGQLLKGCAIKKGEKLPMNQ